MATGSYLSILTLNGNLNGLNAPTERQKLAEWIQKENKRARLLSDRNEGPHSAERHTQ